MSSRPASPPPISRWPFYAGVVILLVIAGFVLLNSARPFPTASLIVALVCAGAGIVLGVAPDLIENDKRLRLAEAAARDAADAQLRRLAQTADQLAHAVSRSQSTEEQAGQALGTLEEVAERLVAQADELAGALTRAGERENSIHTEEIQRLTEERDQKLTGLEIRLNATSLALTEMQAAVKKASASTHRAIESLAARLEEVAEQMREALAARTVAPAPPPAEPDLAAHGSADAPVSELATHPFETEHPTIDIAVNGPKPAGDPDSATDPAVSEAASGETTAPEAASAVILDTAADVPPSPTEDTPAQPPPRAPRKPRHQHAVEHHDVATEPGEAPAQPTAPLELALEGMPEPRPVMRLNRREPAGSTSLVATAYIGIGNKLYLRGDGPGLSWETGVPMQFLAIGKWGWTTTEATAPVTCRVYRNDDTPMLEENAVIDPGTKTEITPKF